jgi:MOSC domain-containing protein YiiM
MTGEVYSINVSRAKGTKKEPVESVTVHPDRGIDGDAHSGPWHRQVSLLAWERIQEACPPGVTPAPGIYAENITTCGLDLVVLRIGDRLAIDDTVLEVTQIGKECHTACEIRKLSGTCIMPKEGIFAKCISGGTVRKGSRIEITAEDDSDQQPGPNDQTGDRCHGA